MTLPPPLFLGQFYRHGVGVSSYTSPTSLTSNKNKKSSDPRGGGGINRRQNLTKNLVFFSHRGAVTPPPPPQRMRLTTSSPTYTTTVSTTTCSTGIDYYNIDMDKSKILSFCYWTFLTHLNKRKKMSKVPHMES